MRGAVAGQRQATVTCTVCKDAEGLSQRGGTRHSTGGLNTRQVLSSLRSQENSELPALHHRDECSSAICKDESLETEKLIKWF